MSNLEDIACNLCAKRDGCMPYSDESLVIGAKGGHVPLMGECSVCNNYLSGNIGEYTPELINRIGQDKFDYLLANKSKVASYDVEWIKRAIKIARKGVKRYEKRLN